MHTRLLPALLLGCCLSAAPNAQELVISCAAGTYNAGEKIWVNLSVLNAATVPGAYKISLDYNASGLNFLRILPAETGPFTMTPAATGKQGSVTVAGFQGIIDSGAGSVSLATLEFSPAGEKVEIDTSSFSVTDREIYSPRATVMELAVSKQSTSVLLGASTRAPRQAITVVNKYIRFTVPRDGLTSVRIFDLNGRMVAEPLQQTRCKAGYQAVPIGAPLRSGIYIVAVRGAGLSIARKLEVAR